MIYYIYFLFFAYQLKGAEEFGPYEKLTSFVHGVVAYGTWTCCGIRANLIPKYMVTEIHGVNFNIFSINITTKFTNFNKLFFNIYYRF